MEFTKMATIKGKSGLFEVLATSEKRFIVQSLTDKKRFPVNATHELTLLESIAIYTQKEEVLLRTVFKTIFEKEKGVATISHKENENKLTSYFKEILPNYDEDHVYPSTIKKIIQWYNILIKAGLDFSKIEDTPTNNEEN